MAEYNPKYAAGYYNDLAKTGAGHMVYKDTVFVEGTSDADFFQKVIGDKYRWSGLNGKDNVIDTRNKYINQQYPTNCKNCYFCIDRDYDDVLQKVPEECANESLYYQMCHEGRSGGYNDLECFLFASPIFDYVLRSKFGLQPDAIKDFRNQIVTVAAWMGSYRVANRLMQLQTGSGVFICNLKPNDTIVDAKEFGNHEVNPAFLFQENLARIKKGSIVVDWPKFEKKMGTLVKSRYCYDFVVNKAHEIQELLGNAPQESWLDYCRGHDITYLLCVLLKNLQDGNGRLNRHDVENALEDWPLPSESATARSKHFMEQFQMIKELMK